jgi:mRNA-degrading endonuclease RelE of RelBE toxin-antitoxin system
MDYTRLNLWALDVNFQLITILSPYEVQWNVKYYECGDFSIQISPNQYSEDFVYIYTPDRNNTGKIHKINYKEEDNGFSYIELSGYFLEETLNDGIIYPSFNGGINDHVDVAVSNMVTQYKEDPELIIATPTQFGTDCNFQPELGVNLMNQTYNILQLHQCSYRVVYDFESNKKVFSIWQGLDRTQENTDGNNFVTFSTKFNNIKSPDVIMDDIKLKNYAVVKGNMSGDNDIYELVDLSNGGIKKKTYIDSTDVEYTEGMSEQTYRSLLHTAGEQKLLSEYCSEFNTQFDVLPNSYIYGEDFNLGDKISIIIEGINLSITARIVAIYEVLKDNAHDITLEVGNQIYKGGLNK